MKTAQNTGAKGLKIMWRSKVRVAAALAAFLLFSTLVIGARAWLRAPVDMVAVTLQANGFKPSETTHSAGSFSLSITNQSGIEGLTLRLTRDNGELLQELPIAQGAQTTNMETTLAAGGYTLTEATHPAWLFHIKVQ